MQIKLPESVVSFCLEQGLTNYGAEYAIGRNGQKTGPFNGTTATFLLLVEHRADPENAAVKARILEQLISVSRGGNEPHVSLGSEWSPANFTSMIALASKTPSIWQALSEDTRDRLDFLMRCMTYAAAFATNDCNDYLTTLEMTANYRKNWNPNYRFTNVVPMIASGIYFGSAEAVDEILLAFDHKATLAACEKYGFVNLHRILSIPTTELLEKGGTAYGASGNALGEGLGVKQKYLYNQNSLDHPERILNDLLTFNFKGGAVNSGYADKQGNPLAFIRSGKTSPYEGMIGMYFELGGDDAYGIRSSAGYSLADFNMSTVALLLLLALDRYDLSRDMGRELMNKVWVGNHDLIFKLDEGYMGYANGRQTGFIATSGYAANTALKTLWEQVLFEQYIDYRP